MEREPLTEEQLRVNAAAVAVHPRAIHPEDEEMRAVCESLVDRGGLVEVLEGPEDDIDPDSDELVGYRASDQLREAMLIRAAMN